MGPGDFEILTKGCVDVVTPASLKEKLARGKPLTVKVGFDPTAPDIHLGHTVLMRKMKHFQDAGHRVVFVIGDFTGMIGDPTGKSKTRPPLTREEIEANAETYKRQAFKILDPAKTETRFNREWLGALGSDGMVRLAATYNVARMLERREFRQRFDAGQTISVHEFLYPLAQAYDSVALEADVELGGTDQLFNLNVGLDIMPAYGLEPQVVMTTPLLEGTDGVEKMSKSLGNYIGVAESADAMFAKVLSISDELMWKYYLLLTDLAPSEIEKERELARPMDSKLALARRIAADFHGTALAAAAEAEWRRVHQARQAPSEMPEKTIRPGRHKWRELLVMAGFAPSNGAAERLLRQRAVKKDGVVVEGGELEAEAGQSLVVSVGAARFVRFRVETP
ncbi:MAG TPA: tyrosine--tRNA ligase [Vicinamibacteria bacterium]|nr:tyrosine--tRNA ligase [Vicinamibacteria bacterium]